MLSQEEAIIIHRLHQAVGLRRAKRLHTATEEVRTPQQLRIFLKVLLYLRPIFEDKLLNLAALLKNIVKLEVILQHLCTSLNLFSYANQAVEIVVILVLLKRSQNLVLTVRTLGQVFYALLQSFLS